MGAMMSNKWIVLVLALVFWAGYFHTIDWVLMEAQGLPVKTSLMPK
jgi:hypothetical protein